MSLREMIADYLSLRRSLGYSLKGGEQLLLNFAAFLERESCSFITTALALQWATGNGLLSPSTCADRLATVRKFAQFILPLDSRTEVPPPDCFPYRRARPSPYIYSPEEVVSLMEAIPHLRSPSFSRATFSTLIGLLAATGMRVGEAIGLDRSDLDRREGVLTIRNGKFGKSRELVLHHSTEEALRRYERERDQSIPAPLDSAFFLSRNGRRRLVRQNVSKTFDTIRRKAGLANRKPRRPRIHDLRHSFAVHTLTDWYRKGLDVEQRLPLLSTYLGHVNPTSTYWYLTSTPGLTGLAAKLLEQHLGDLP